ncbi:YggS family pyridoxal phosphate-dependent enzyme [Bradyrhizobium prioriisuperbiae]|uniref:YggS family pyridoxal phosphate-dependent enzyme n=1 Tax=Bradyrhizobium prioriisuperbiae TaxID=2854389 RepID=UPI0028E8DA69|nr:YggS family pyridoxal phosphate-dependent enzyme [Bradyrhizobium prioritasuperba]
MPEAEIQRERFGDDPETTFRQNLLQLESRIAAACARANRPRSAIQLLPVTKTVPASIVRVAVGLGLHCLGENKVQEAAAKSDALSDLEVRWAVIGHLQTNKAKQLVTFASEFHALDSLRVAEALHRHLVSAGRQIDVFIQVNTSNEASKYGLPPNEVEAFARRLPEFPTLKPQGLMTLAVLTGEADRVRACFRSLRGLRDQLRLSMPTSGLDQLSMGMTGDFEMAIEEGADVVRVGQAIFGRRPTKDGHYWPGLIPSSGSSEQA